MALRAGHDNGPELVVAAILSARMAGRYCENSRMMQLTCGDTPHDACRVVTASFACFRTEGIRDATSQTAAARTARGSLTRSDCSALPKVEVLFVSQIFVPHDGPKHEDCNQQEESGTAGAPDVPR